MRELRFRVTDNIGNVRYVTVLNGTVSCYSTNETPLSLGYIAENAAQLRFDLQDAETHRFEGSKSGGNIFTPTDAGLKALNKHCHKGQKIEGFVEDRWSTGWDAKAKRWT